MPAMQALIVAIPLADADRRPLVSAGVVIAVVGDGAWRIAPDEDDPGTAPVDLAGDGESRTADTLRALCAALGFGEART